MTKGIHIKIDPKDPDFSKVREIARSSRTGKVIAFPTETVYGMGGPMSCRGLKEKLIELKGRDEKKPFSYHIGDWEMVDFLGVVRTPVFRFLTKRHWPGPLTLVVLNQEGKKIGIRFPRHPLTAALISATGEPFIGTSANLSNSPSPFSGEEVIKQMGDRIDIILDSGVTEFKNDSTVLDISEDKPVILRRGVAAEAVQKDIDRIAEGNYPRKKILLVCTGNSCRSPMALGWLRSELAKQGLAESVEVDSCGIGTRDGMPATAEAVYVMKNREIDISKHKSRVCTKEDIIEADVIIAMSKEHNTFITSLVPSSRGKIKVLNIKDPIGSPMSVYEEVMNEMETRLEECWDWIVE